MNTLEKRIIELSYRHKLSHVSSCLNTVNFLNTIYEKRKETEPVILCNGHAGLALYVVLEKFGFCDAEEMLLRHGIHPARDLEHGVWCSSGSLGQAETIAVGMALADLERTVWLITSDGACAEGSVWEAFRNSREQNLTNLNIEVIANGYGAYGAIDPVLLGFRLASFIIYGKIKIHQPKMPVPWLEGLAGHYLQLSAQQYEELMAL